MSKTHVVLERITAPWWQDMICVFVYDVFFCSSKEKRHEQTNVCSVILIFFSLLGFKGPEFSEYLSSHIYL